MPTPDNRRRRAEEERRRVAARRRLRFVFVAVALAGVLVLVVAFNGNDSESVGTPVRDSGSAVPIHTGPPPWPPVYEGLKERTERADFPVVGDESYHVHTLL